MPGIWLPALAKMAWEMKTKRHALNSDLWVMSAMYGRMHAGDPNHNYDSLRWTALGQLIQDK